MRAACRIDSIASKVATMHRQIEIWTYARRDRTITLWVVDETVVQIEDKAANTR